jgi:NTE family protein
MRNTALVLSSGGARGCAHIGAIKVLEKHGFKITSVAGTSMGALVGGIYSTGQLSAFEEWISSLDMMEVLRLTDFSISSKGLVKGKKVFEKIREIVPDRNIEDLNIPFCAVATDILKGVEVVFNDGNLYDAIRASISIPNVFQPHRIGDMYLVDGGLMNPIPVNRVKRSGDDIMVVVDVSAPIHYEHREEVKEEHAEHRYSEQIMAIREKLGNYFPFMDNDDDDDNDEIDGIGIFNLSSKSIGTMMRKIAELTLEKAQPDILINLPKESFSTYDFYKAKEIIEEGEAAAIDALRLSGYIA